MTDLLTYAYAEITKADKTPDGDLMVFGKAAGPDLDLDKQRCSPAWLEKAMPKWYELGNIREQHGQNAAGIGVEMTQNGDSWMLKAEIVDKGAVRKVEKRVYKGFSIGVKNARIMRTASAPNGLIVGGDIVEISLVDRPSNPDARMSICKSAGGGLFVPTDERGNAIMPEENEFGGQWLSADLHKSALVTAQDVLDGNFSLEDETVSRETIEQLADLLIAEGMTLKSADLGAPVDISNLRKAADALMFFVDSDVSDFPGGEPGMRAAFQEFLAKSAIAENGDRGSLVAADLVKAVTQAQAPLLAQLEALQDELAEVKKTAVPGGPVTIVRTPAPVLREQTKADFLLAQAQRPEFASDIQDLLVKSAHAEAARGA